MVKKLLPLLLLLLLLTGCGAKKQVYQTVYLDVFDTVTTVRGYETCEEAFQQRAEQVHRALLEYHRLFDIYNDWPGGLKDVNDNAGAAPVQVDGAVLELLADCREDYERTGGKVNAAMGSVLSLAPGPGGGAGKSGGGRSAGYGSAGRGRKAHWLRHGNC